MLQTILSLEMETILVEMSGITVGHITIWLPQTIQLQEIIMLEEIQEA